MLADLVEIPNLYTEGSRYLARLAQRIFLGVSNASRLGWRWRDVLVRIYGAAAFCWRIVVCASLAIAASVIFHGAGLILAVVGIAAWLIPATLRALRAVARQHQVNPFSTVRAILAAAIVVSAGAALFYLPWPGAYTAPGVVEYRDLVVVRAESPGFVSAIYVRDGQLVRAGQTLVELTNDQLQAEVGDLELAVLQSEKRRRIHLQKDEQGAVQVELENQRALQKRLAEKQHQLDNLTVRAPAAGRVMARNLKLLPMTYLKEGAEILAIGNDDRKQLRVSIAQEDAPLFADRQGRSVRFRIRSAGAEQGRLSRVVPRATKKPPHAALCAPYGGPLTVKARQGADETEDAYELVVPRFAGIVELPDDLGRRLHAGQFAYVTIGSDGTESVAEVLHRRVHDWVDKKLAAATARWREK
jgi:putative peptide zinc metalloprotease protein